MVMKRVDDSYPTIGSLYKWLSTGIKPSSIPKIKRILLREILKTATLILQMKEPTTFEELESYLDKLFAIRELTDEKLEILENELHERIKKTD
jgi:hypothetical protein